LSVREELVSIRGFGVVPASATISVHSLSGKERARRAGFPPMIGVGVAILVLPIPIVHLAVPPMAILGGLFLGIRRGLQREIISQARGSCPFCGVEQSLGLTGTNYHLPRDLKCSACLRPLTLEAAA
jgi:hypothetical protein